MVEATKCSIDFFRQMPQELRESIEVNIDDLIAKYQNDIASNFLYSGKIALSECKWEDAGKNFKEAFDKGFFSTKLKALVGLICGWSRIDLEWPAKIMNRLR